MLFGYVKLDVNSSHIRNTINNYTKPYIFLSSEMSNHGRKMHPHYVIALYPFEGVQVQLEHIDAGLLVRKLVPPERIAHICQQKWEIGKPLCCSGHSLNC